MEMLPIIAVAAFTASVTVAYVVVALYRANRKPEKPSKWTEESDSQP